MLFQPISACDHGVWTVSPLEDRETVLFFSTHSATAPAGTSRKKPHVMPFCAARLMNGAMRPIGMDIIPAIHSIGWKPRASAVGARTAAGLGGDAAFVRGAGAVAGE